MDLIDEFKDEFPTILRLSQSNQKREPMRKPSKIRMAIALAKINRGTLIQGLNTISRSSKSVAKLLQPQLACRLLELRAISHRLLKEVNAPRQPLYNVQVKDKNLKRKMQQNKNRVIFLACRPHFYFILRADPIFILSCAQTPFLFYLACRPHFYFILRADPIFIFIVYDLTIIGPSTTSIYSQTHEYFTLLGGILLARI
ncbi:PREDICTED: spermatogenesis-associated protein 9 isoform X2 [Capra hircus]|uniref:spermatogenesis-associated protein 9 isoform X2 n=1 Tax=Capra hircus TaxID=9925 RepID=UPI0008478104|nr:PREDICTED: spermatogenesis-associated protein 9 isoform X2 [Capra hircus]